jgi:hypothetical protein
MSGFNKVKKQSQFIVFLKF